MNNLRKVHFRQALVILAAVIFGFSATVKLHSQTPIGYSDFVDDEGEVEVTVSMIGNESEIDGSVEVDNLSFALYEDIAYVNAEGELYDGNSLVGFDQDPYWETDISVAAPVAQTTVGHTYELDGWAAACYIYDEEGDCEPEWVGYLPLYLDTNAPSITSISPNSAVIGTPSGTITVTGQNLIDELLLTGVCISSSSVCANGDDFGIQATPASGNPNQVQITYSIASNASTGAKSLVMANDFGISNPMTFTVGYPPAVVTSLSPSTWQAGTTFTLTIYGTGFGNQPTVNVSGAGVSCVASCQTSNTAADGSSTQVNVSVAQNAPNGISTVQVQPGYAGNSFICGNCDGGSGMGSDSAPVQAVTPAPQIMFNGNNISGTTQMVVAGQQIVLSVPTPNGYNIQSQSWSFSNQSAITGGFVNGAGTPGTQPSASAGGSEAADPSLNQNSLTFYWVNPGDNGETVTYTYTLDNGQSASATATFNISGPTGNLLPSAFARSDITGTSLTNVNGTAQMSMANSPTKPGVGVFINDNAEPVSNGIPCPPTPGAPPAAGCGQFIWVQILNSVTQYQVVPSGDTFTPLSATNQLDGSYPYPNGTNNGINSANATWDSPGRGLFRTWGEGAEPFSATMYVLWDPALPAGCIPAWIDTSTTPYTPHASQCASIPIPLGSVQWSWSACAINALTPAAGGGTPPSWFLQCGRGSGNTAGVASGYPQWSSGTGPGGCAKSDNGNCQ